ncbi:NlpC/P60 family protein [Frondihabitans sucicola]|uniref:C40 family peptidase n=1 Tax=Frondihabitans sucicola TaxID=1268041 RepID=UPI002572DA66|nr:NlpC/P60 family protein [Frondihabitans sucicola]
MLIVLSVSAGLVATSAVGLVAPAQASPYPSWSDVQAAKGDEAAAKKQIASIDDAITSLQQRAQSTSDSVSGAGERYQVAVLAEQKAKAELDGVAAEKKKAAAAAKVSQERVGQLVAELSHEGGGQLTVTMLTESSHASDLLYQLGTMTNLTSRTTSLLQQARQDQNLATALSDQAAAAQKALSKRTQAAAAALKQANSLADTAAAALANQQKNQSQLIAQVAYLRGTTAQVEEKYYAGVAAGSAGDTTPVVPGKTSSGSGAGSATNSGTGTAPSKGASPSKAASPPKAPAPSHSSNPAPSKPSAPAPPTPTPPKPTPPSSGSSAAINTAVAFARAQLGKTYVFGGAGPNVWDCSGLMMGSYSAAGVYIGGHSVRYQYDYLQGEGRLVPISSMRVGDIIFYHNATDGMYHDAMYVGGGSMLEAPNPNAKVRIVAVRYFELYAVGRPVG